MCTRNEIIKIIRRRSRTATTETVAIAAKTYEFLRKIHADRRSYCDFYTTTKKRTKLHNRVIDSKSCIRIRVSGNQYVQPNAIYLQCLISYQNVSVEQNLLFEKLDDSRAYTFESLENEKTEIIFFTMAESREMLLDVKLDLKDVKTDNCLKVSFSAFFAQ